MKSRHTGLFVIFAGLITTPGLAQEPTIAELLERIEAQDRRIAELERQQATLEQEQEQTDSELEATVDFVETLEIEPQQNATTIGGYGELHYNNLSASDPSNDLKEIDFHRFVLFVGHRFSDRINFFSEIEIEHSLAGDGAPGEVELEQAYVDIALGDSLAAKAGLFLLPVGILNETHEPPTFYGVERNSVENVILPTTWWEAGGGFRGNLANGISWDAVMHSGLAMETTGSNAWRVRSGRQKVAEALANNWAYTGRVRYTGIPGLELAASLQYQSDPTQVAGDGLDSGRLFSTHAIYQVNDFTLKALYGSWDFEGAGVEAAGADEQDGWFIEPSYQLNPNWGIYGRYEDVDGAREVDQFDQVETGFNYWPHPSVVFKFTYRDRTFDLPSQSDRDFDGFDLGVGYQF